MQTPRRSGLQFAGKETFMILKTFCNAMAFPMDTVGISLKEVQK